jgi:hypothetical protein
MMTGEKNDDFTKKQTKPKQNNELQHTHTPKRQDESRVKSQEGQDHCGTLITLG